MTTARRVALVAVPFGAATAAYVGIFLARYDRLPERIATHFGGGGEADDFMGRATALWFGGGLLLALGLLFTLSLLRPGGAAGRRLTTALGAGLAVTLGYPLIATVLVNSDLGDPAEARLPMWHLAVLLPAAAAVGWLAWWAAGADPGRAAERPVAALSLADGEAAAWSRTAASGALLAAAGLGLGVGVLVTLFGSLPAGLVALALALLCAAFAGVRVTVDRRGIAVRSVLLPRPRIAVPLHAVAGAASVRVEAVGDFGGWGYRIRPGRRGVVLRSGEALSARLSGGREFVVTVDDSATAAALLNGLVERRSRERD
ncbi:DUF1648 domain-containing protein [Streptomyces millisiae]|uniref:DUF1648 domain-containing protein n=1 Tax=Streptomyces millisiae TaxID=3075542 RepID=A0ABU2LY67_9ACTN|nr:DUF1648 domain-containing protein [Streptomyces sp. DSM 44918]MDT0322534.1 DUF1648 domain-containing protein [Streptomyces sp. DSM 44918]